MEINEGVLRKIVRRVISETIDELTGYHGSKANFGKFNHKKFLGTGAGSQVFGWGTYITSDPIIGKSYADTDSRNTNIDQDNIQLTSSYDLYNYIDKTKYNGKQYEDIIDELRSDLETYFNNNVSELIEGLEQQVVQLTLRMQRSYGVNKRNLQYQIQRTKAKMDILNNLNFSTESYLYEVEIPDDDGTNYINWYAHVPPQFMGRIYNTLFKLKRNYLDAIAKNNYPFRSTIYQYIDFPDKKRLIDILLTEDDYDTFFANSYYTEKKDGKGGEVYWRLKNLFGSPKAASLFLIQCGFVGIKYEAGTRMAKPDGAANDAMNYVIFNANDVKILNKNKVSS